MNVLALVCTAFLCLGSSGSLPLPRHQTPPASENARPPLRRLDERLQRRPREERARLERHLREFEELPREAQVRLLERARALRALERSLEEKRARERRAPREELGPELGHERGPEISAEQSRAQLREGLRARGRELRSRMPPELRLRLEQAPPEQRRAVLERLMQRYEHESRRALTRMRADLGLSERELQRLQRLPLPERLKILREHLDRSRSDRDGRVHRRVSPR